MKKFNFRLQTLLDARAEKEKQIRNELSKAVSEQNKLRVKQKQYLDGVESQKRVYHERFLQGEVGFREMQMYQRYSVFADQVVRTSQKEIDAMEPALNEIRGRLAQATREKRVIEKLKEKRHDEWKYEYNREQEKEADEMNQKIFQRQRQEVSDD